MMEKGSARLGITVAETLRRKRKITMTTRPRVSTMVNLTSLNDSRMVSDRSYRMSMFTEGGSSALNNGSILMTPSVHGEGADDGKGQRQAGNHGGGDVAQEEEDHHDNQAQGQHHGDLDVVERFPDGVRPVVQNVHVHRRRQFGFEQRQHIDDAVGSRRRRR